MQRDEHQDRAEAEADGDKDCEAAGGSDGTLQYSSRRRVSGQKGQLTRELLQCSENVLQASGMAENVLIPTRDSMRYQNGFHLLYYWKHENHS